MYSNKSLQYRRVRCVYVSNTRLEGVVLPTHLVWLTPCLPPASGGVSAFPTRSPLALQSAGGGAWAKWATPTFVLIATPAVARLPAWGLFPCVARTPSTGSKGQDALSARRSLASCQSQSHVCVSRLSWSSQLRSPFLDYPRLIVHPGHSLGPGHFEAGRGAPPR